MNTIVTGAASGIGAAIVQSFLERGDKVAAVDSAFSEIVDLGDDLRLFERDITKESALRDPLRHFGLTDPVDVLVNCAGVAGRRDFHYMDKVEWDRVVEVNLWGTANCCQQFLQHCLNTGPQMGGQSIVNIGSMTGFIGNGKGFTNAHYAASKAGVVGLTKALAIEYAPYNIRVNAVCPGPIMTPMLVKFRENKPDLFRQFLDDVPLGRTGQPEDVAQAVLYLVDARWATGTILVLDGGFTSQ